MWHAQGFWAQAGLALLFSWTFFEKPKRRSKPNIPLGLLHLWIAISTAWFCFMGQMNGRYETAHFFPYFNFLCIILLYKIFVLYLDRKRIEKILIGIRYVLIATLIVSALQIFDLSQIFRRISAHHTHNNIVTGFLGNGTHLSGFLACCSPVFFWKMKRIDILSLVLLVLVLLHTGTTIGDPSISGFIILPILFFYFFKNNNIAMGVLALLVMLFIIALPYIPKHFFSFQGRFPLWRAYWPYFKRYAVTGTGLGAVNLTHNMIYKPPGMEVRQLHLEYYQFAFELGLIGLGLIFNLIYSFCKKIAETRLQLVLKSMVIGFLLSSLFNFPAHLWLPSIWTLFAYAGFLTIRKNYAK
jgi:hypothetical protein